MELLIGAVLAIIAWMLWNGMRPPGATVKSSLERERRRRDKGPGDDALKFLLLLVPALLAVLWDTEALAAVLLR